jgi:hypothetical protein
VRTLLYVFESARLPGPRMQGLFALLSDCTQIGSDATLVHLKDLWNVLGAFWGFDGERRQRATGPPLRIKNPPLGEVGTGKNLEIMQSIAIFKGESLNLARPHAGSSATVSV